MKSNKLKGNIAMGVSKTFSGFNENALRYLLPTWMNAWSGVMLRLGFGAAIFWIMGIFNRKKATKISAKDKVKLLVLGALCMTGYMLFLLLGLTYTTPISSSIFISLEPVVVFLICVMFMGEKVTGKKVLGIFLGLSGALICILMQKESDVASNPLLGNVFCLMDCIVYSIYLVISGQFLKRIDKITVSKWSFLGGALAMLCVIPFAGWYAPVLHERLFSAPMLSLLFILIFPTFVSYLLVDIGLKYLNTTVVALYGYLILIVATVMSYILGQDHFEWSQMAAIVLIIFSVYYVEVAESRPESAKVSDGH